MRNSMIAVGLMLLMPSLGCGCQEEALDEVKSIDNKSIATDVTRDCGATTQGNTWVSIRNSSHNRDDSKQVFVVKRYPHAMDVSWKDANHLTVHCRDCKPDEIILQIVKLDSIQVSYE